MPHHDPVPALTPFTFLQSLESMQQAVTEVMTTAPTTRDAYEQTLVEILNDLMPPREAPPNEMLYFLALHPMCMTYDMGTHGDAEAYDDARDALSLAALLRCALYNLLYTHGMDRAPTGA